MYVIISYALSCLMFAFLSHPSYNISSILFDWYLFSCFISFFPSDYTRLPIGHSMITNIPIYTFIMVVETFCVYAIVSFFTISFDFFNCWFYKAFRFFFFFYYIFFFINNCIISIYIILFKIFFNRRIKIF